MNIRHLEERDYVPIITVIDEWGGRHMADMLPKLFFIHFRDTSLAAEEQGQIVAFSPVSSRGPFAPKVTSIL